MKILYMILKNFSGIYSGTGKKEIKVDFENSKNKIIMLLGENGSGKTTILSCLHPFRETNDNRKTFILDKCEGYKEISYQNGNDIYVIKHFYHPTQSNKNKSYISKNGVEMNENGGIKLFDQYVNEEFNLDKDYFKIGRLGANVQNFIDLNTSDRKKYMNKFVPNIDEYLESFEIVSEKVKSFNRDVTQLKKELESLNEDELILSLTEVEDEINFLDEEISNKKEKITHNKTLLELVEKDLGDINRSILEHDISMFQLDLEKCEVKLNEVYCKYPKLKEYTIEQAKSKKMESEINFKNNTEKLESIYLNIDKVEINLNKINGKINSSKNKLNNMSNIDTKEIKNTISMQKNNYESKLEKLNNLKRESIIHDIDSDNLNKMNEELVSLEVACAVFTSYDNEDIKTVTKSFNNSLLIDNLNKELGDLEVKRDKISKEINYIESRERLKTIYDKKPSNCVNRSCIFIQDAVKYVEEELPTYNNLCNSLAEIDEIILSKEDELKYQEKLFNCKQEILKIEKMNENNIRLNSFYNIDIFEFVNNSTSFFNNIKNDIRTYNSIIVLESEINALITKIEKDEQLLEIGIQQDKLYEELKDEIKSLEEDKENILNEINNLKEQAELITKDVQKYERTIKVMTEIADIKEEYSKNKEYYDSLVKTYEDNLDNLEKYDNLLEEIDELTKSLDLNRLNILKEKRDNLKNDIAIFKKYSTRLNDIESKLNNYILIKDSLDPKKGIPLIFLDNFLKNIAKKTNDLLQKVYDGDFKIEFEINSKDFFIKVLKSDGTILNDISEASQGEISLTTISLSLSMIENLIKDSKYKIIYLDEIDSTLSSRNRRLFLDLLQVQLDLGIEQVFIISHNDEFYSQDIDLILMKDNGVDINNPKFMEGKNILFNVYDNK